MSKSIPLPIIIFLHLGSCPDHSKQEKERPPNSQSGRQDRTIDQAYPGRKDMREIYLRRGSVISTTTADKCSAIDKLPILTSAPTGASIRGVLMPVSINTTRLGKHTPSSVLLQAAGPAAGAASH